MEHNDDPMTFKIRSNQRQAIQDLADISDKTVSAYLRNLLIPAIEDAYENHLQRKKPQTYVYLDSLTVLVPRKIKRNLAVLAQANNMSVSQYLRDLISELTEEK